MLQHRSIKQNITISKILLLKLLYLRLRLTRLGQHKMKLPDMNLEAATSSADEQTLEYQEPITSRTQSLWIKKLYFPMPSMLILWNRLMISMLVADGLRVLCTFIDPASDSIGNLSLKRFLESSMALASKNHGEEQMVVGEATTLKTRGETSDIDSAKKNRELLLSKSWISRWCRHEETPKKIPNAGGEPRNSNLLVEGRNKKQFPSIGANGPYGQDHDVRNRGAVMVWNTKGF